MVDKKKYPDRKVLEKEAEKHFDEKTGKTYEIEAKYKTEPVNRISIPLEQDIVNIQTAFTVGTEPSMDCTPTDDDEKKLLDAVKAVFKSNKIKYQNKKIVRAWLDVYKRQTIERGEKYITIQHDETGFVVAYTSEERLNVKMN